MKFLKVLFAIYLAVLLIILPAVVVFAGGPVEEGSAEVFLWALLGAPAVGAFVYAVFTHLPYVAEWFEKLGRKAKRLTVMIACFIVPHLAMAALLWIGATEFIWDLEHHRGN